MSSQTSSELHAARYSGSAAMSLSPAAGSPIDLDLFSTPPSTPSAFPPQRPTNVRKLSRPQSIQIDKSHAAVGNLPDIATPNVTDSQQGDPFRTTSHPMIADKTIVPGLHESHTSGNGNVASAVASHLSSSAPPLKAHPISPCFVHSLLDKGISLTDWLKNTSSHDARSMPSDDSDRHSRDLNRSSSSSQRTSPTPSDGTSSNSFGFIPSPDTDEEEDGVNSVTRQLAATAIGVREMSKQLGRARVKSNIQSIMIITKARDNRLIQLTRDLALYVMSKRTAAGRGMVVYVDHQLRASKRFDAEGIQRDYPDYFRPVPRRSSTSNAGLSANSGAFSMSSIGGADLEKDRGQLRYWTSDMCSKSPQLFDFVVTLGGDGTVLFTSWLFQTIVPPVLPFALGSLGFLTNFDFSDHARVMDNIIDSGIRVNLRMRFTCTVYRAVKPEDERGGKKRRAVKKGDTGEIMMKNLEEGGWEYLEGTNAVPPASKCRDKEIMCFTTRPAESFEVLNDLVVDRGPSPYMSLLELFGDEYHMTTVQADGLTISTPTGSTAYSLSAGGSLVHPEIPAILITPICPHTLSFRPMLLPDSMELRVCVPYNSRSTAWASFDGRGRVELRQGDHIKITASKFPFPTVCADNQSTDWFQAISRTLKWNERERQKSFVVVEDDSQSKDRKKVRRRDRKVDSTPNATDRVQLNSPPAIPTAKDVNGDLEGADESDDDSDDAEEEEEKFDIDDSSPEAVQGATPSSSQPTSIAGSLPTSPKRTTEPRPTSYAAQRAVAMLGAGRVPSQSTSRSGIETPSRYGAPAPSSGGFSAKTPRPMAFRPPSSPQVPAASATPASAGLSPEHAIKIKRSAGGHRRGRSVGDASSCKRKAFAVYGQDESDSNASDS